MKETYKVKRPDRIIWGDPLYMKEYSGERLKSLIVDIQPPNHYEARVVLEEQPMEEFSDMMINSMTIYLAPKETIETYMQDMMYEEQHHTERNIGVDTAKYCIQVDKSKAVIHTGGDGYWGSYQEMFRMAGEQKILDAAIITIEMSENETMESMRGYLKYFFDDVSQIENVEAVEEQGKGQEQNM